MTGGNFQTLFVSDQGCSREALERVPFRRERARKNEAGKRRKRSTIKFGK